MAEPMRANAFGRFYVTHDCDGCGICVEIAPLNFTFSPQRDYCAVYAQPVGDEEVELVQQAMTACPLHAVGSDGDAL